MKLASLKGDYAFRRMRKGQAAYTKYLMLRWLPEKKTGVRVGIVVSKKVGKAVQRNLVRRRIKEALRALLSERSLQPLATGRQLAAFDLLLVAKPDAVSASYAQIKVSLAHALEQSKLLLKQETLKQEGVKQNAL